MNAANSASDLLRQVQSPCLYQNESAVLLVTGGASGAGGGTDGLHTCPVHVTINTDRRIHITPTSSAAADATRAHTQHTIHLRSVRAAVSLAREELTLYLSGVPAVAPLQLRFASASDVDQLLAHMRYLLLSTYSRYPINVLPGSTAADLQTQIKAALSVAATSLPEYQQLLQQQQQLNQQQQQNHGFSVQPECGLALAVLPPTRVETMMTAAYPHFVAENAVPAGPCGGWARAYADICEYYGVKPSAQWLWYMDAVFGARQSRTLTLADVPHFDLTSRDTAPLLYSLQWNGYFDALHIVDGVLGGGKSAVDSMLALAAVLGANSSLKELKITGSAAGLLLASREFMTVAVEALALNQSSRVASIEFADGGASVDDKAVAALGALAHRLPAGLSSLRLAECNVAKKPMVQLLCALKRPASSANRRTSIIEAPLNTDVNFSKTTLLDSLSCLDLSGAVIPGDGLLALSDFLAQPNRLRKLALSHCTIPNAEVLFGALVRGCAQELQELDLSGNRFTVPSSDSAQPPPSFSQFFSAAQRLTVLNVSSTRLPASYLQAILASIASNYGSAGVALHLAANDFGSKEAAILRDGLRRAICLTALDLSDNSFDGDDGLVAVLEGLKSHPKLERLQLDRVITKSSTLHVKAGRSTGKQRVPDASILCAIVPLRVLSLAGNASARFTAQLLSCLGGDGRSDGLGKSSTERHSDLHQASLVSLDVTGNFLGDSGAYLLARMVQHSTTLTALSCCDNDFTAVGWAHIAAAVELNGTLQSLPVVQPDLALAVQSKSVLPRSAAASAALFRAIDIKLARNIATCSFSAPTNAHTVGSTMMSSPTATISPTTRDATTAFVSVEDAELSLAQQESLQKYSTALRRLVRILLTSNRSTTLTTETRSANERCADYASRLIADVGNSSTALTQLGLLVENSLSEQMDRLHKQTAAVTADLVQHGRDSWRQAQEQAVKLLAEQMPVGLAGSLDINGNSNNNGNNGNALSAQLQKVVQLGTAGVQLTESGSGGGFHAGVDAATAHEYRRRVAGGYASLLAIAKSLAAERMTSQLDRMLHAVQQRIEETERERTESGLVSPSSPSAASIGSPTTATASIMVTDTLSRSPRRGDSVVAAPGVDTSSLAAVAAASDASPALLHVARRARGASNRRPPASASASRGSSIGTREGDSAGVAALRAEAAKSEPQPPPASRSELTSAAMPPPKVPQRSRRPSESGGNPVVVSESPPLPLQPPSPPLRPRISSAGQRRPAGSHTDVAATKSSHDPADQQQPPPPPAVSSKPRVNTDARPAQNATPLAAKSPPVSPPALMPPQQQQSVAPTAPPRQAVVEVEAPTAEAKKALRDHLSNVLMQPKAADRPMSTVTAPPSGDTAGSAGPASGNVSPLSGTATPTPASTPAPTPAAVNPPAQSAASQNSAPNSSTKKAPKTVAAKLGGLFKRKDGSKKNKQQQDADSAPSSDVEDSAAPTSSAEVIASPATSTATTSQQQLSPPAVAPRTASATTAPATVAVTVTTPSSSALLPPGESSAASAPPEPDQAAGTAPHEESGAETTRKKKYMTATPFAGGMAALSSVQLRSRSGSDTAAGRGATDSQTQLPAADTGGSSDNVAAQQIVPPPRTHRPAVASPLAADGPELRPKPQLPKPSPLTVSSTASDDGDAPVPPADNTDDQPYNRASMMMELKPKPLLPKPVSPMAPRTPDASTSDQSNNANTADDQVAVHGSQKLKISASQSIGDLNMAWEEEALQWASGWLSKAGHEKQFDSLVELVQDGVSLLEIVQCAEKERPFPKYKKNATLPVHRLDNLNILVAFTRIPGVTAEELLNGDIKFVRVYMTALMKIYPAAVEAV